MQKKQYIVILLDVNSIPREDPAPSTLSVSFEEGDHGVDSKVGIVGGAGPYKHTVVKAVKETIIAILTSGSLQHKYCNRPEKTDFSNVSWSLKLFNSSVEVNSKTGGTFNPLGLESIDLFEQQLDGYLDVDSMSSMKSDESVNLAQFLSTSLKSVLSDLPWPDNFVEEGGDNQYQCSIHALFRVPKTEVENQLFMPGWTSGTPNFLDRLLPKAFRSRLRDVSIRLNIMDMSPASSEHCNTQHPFGELSSGACPLFKIIHSFGGKITSFSNFSYSVPLGFPSYSDLLRRLIAETTSQAPVNMTVKRLKPGFDDTQRTISKLHGSMNGSVVQGSPGDTDDDSPIDAHAAQMHISNPSFALSAYNKQQHRRSYPEHRQVHAHEELYRGRTKPNRYSDESRPLNLSQPQFARVASKKRKYEFEEDMESELGYSPRAIEAWCKKGIIKGKGREEGREREQPKQKPRGSRYPEPQRRERERRDRSSEYFKNGGRGEERFSKSMMVQPQKRLKRETRERLEMNETMGPPRTKRQMATTRYKYEQPQSTRPHRSSVPISNKKRAAVNQEVMNARGKVMLREGLKPNRILAKPKKDRNPPTPVAESAYIRRQPSHVTKYDSDEQGLYEATKRMELLLKPVLRTETEGLSAEGLRKVTQNVKLFMELITKEEGSLTAAAQGLVTYIASVLLERKKLPMRQFMEKILLIPAEELQSELINTRGSEYQNYVFRKCELQILIHFEMAWTVSIADKPELEEQFVESVSTILAYLMRHRDDTPIEDFINYKIIPGYHSTHGKLIREITSVLKIDPSSLFNMSYEESTASSSAVDDSVSSVSSCGPEDSTSQHPHQIDNNHLNRSHNSEYSQRSSLKTSSFLVAQNLNSKQALVLPSKKTTHLKGHLKAQSFSTQSGSMKPPAKSPKPKKVRRNLFDVQEGRDPKEVKTLLNLVTTAVTSSFARSPYMFKSPMSKISGKLVGSSPLSPGRRTSPFFALARATTGKPQVPTRSRRRLVLESSEFDSQQHRGWGTISNSPNENLLCPESPFTPGETRLRKPVTPGSKQSSSKSVVQESPEVPKVSAPINNVPKSVPAYRANKIDSVSFYSSGAVSLKSRIWERSGVKVMASRMRELSSSHSQSLHSGDDETTIVSGPIEKEVRSVTQEPEKLQKTIEEDKEKEVDVPNPVPLPTPPPIASSSSNVHIEPSATININSDITALISNEIVSSPAEILSAGRVSNSKSPYSPDLDTPKSVRFRLDLVTSSPPPQTLPSTSLMSTTSTPGKSILKDTGNVSTG